MATLHRCLPFIFVFLVFGVSRQVPGAQSSLRSVAGLEDVLDESCGSEVADELGPEFGDYPGRPKGTKLSVLQRISFPSSVRRGF